jgi:hypothetical protein
MGILHGIPRLSVACEEHKGTPSENVMKHRIF